MQLTFTFISKQADLKLNRYLSSWSLTNFLPLASESAILLYVSTKKEIDMAFQLGLLESYDIFCDFESWLNLGEIDILRQKSRNRGLFSFSEPPYIPTRDQWIQDLYSLPWLPEP